MGLPYQKYVELVADDLKHSAETLAGLNYGSLEAKPNVNYRGILKNGKALQEARMSLNDELKTNIHPDDFVAEFNNYNASYGMPVRQPIDSKDAYRRLGNALLVDGRSLYGMRLAHSELPKDADDFVIGNVNIPEAGITPIQLTPRQQTRFDAIGRNLDLDGLLSDGAIEGGLDPMTGTGIKRSLAEYYNQPSYEPIPDHWDDTPTTVITPPPTSPETAVLAKAVDNSNELLETSKQQLAGVKPSSKAVTQQDLEPTKGVTKTVTKTPEEQGKEWLSLTPEQRSWAKLDYAGIDYSGMDSEQLIQAADGVNEQFYKAFPHFRVAEWQHEQGKTITPLNPKGTTQQPSSQGKPPTIEYNPIGTTERVRKTPKPAPPVLQSKEEEKSPMILHPSVKTIRENSASYDIPEYSQSAQPVATDSKGIPLWQLGLGGAGILGVGYLGAQAMLAQQEKDRQQLGLQSAYGQMPNYY